MNFRTKKPAFVILGICILALSGCAAKKICRIESDSYLSKMAERTIVDEYYKKIYHRESKCIEAAYVKEREYLKLRRVVAQQYNPAVSPVLKETLGVCFSGGGLRSATFNLGVLQAFQKHKCLEQIDYISSVSGGSYISAWFVSHILPSVQRGMPFPIPLESISNMDVVINAAGVVTYAKNPSDLLSRYIQVKPGEGYSTPSQVTHLQGNAMFMLKDKAGFGSAGRLMSYAWRLPFHWVFDVALHWKPTRGKFNWHHPIYIYRKQIEEMYFDKAQGQIRNFEVQHLNPDGSVAPYLIINAALAQGLSPSPGTNQPFEFTRDFCGAPSIGYIPTPLFDKPVVSVLHKCGKAQYARFIDGPPIYPGNKTKPFRLSTAVAASGAASDLAGIGNSGLKLFANLFLKLFNANLRFQTRNFSQTFAEWYYRPIDLFREIVFDRLWRSPKSNTLALSDGAHVENFGIIALAQRHVNKIIIFDASGDSAYTYKSLLQAQNRVNKTTCNVCGKGNFLWNVDLSKLPEFCAPPVPFIKTHLSCRTCSYDAEVFYVKNAYHPEYENVPDYLLAFKQADDTFPHTPTLIQWYEYDRFEAYRMQGYYIADWFFRNNPTLSN